MKPVLAAVLLALLAAVPARPQPADTTLTGLQELARFDEARALAVDPAGLLYVADAGRDVVLRLDGDGRVLATLGGPGAGEGRFDEPADVDPTNGLILLVADAGNGRIQRFSRDFLFLEAIPVGAEGAGGRAPTSSFLPRDSEVTDRAGGRPVAVVSTEAQELLAIDARRRVVVQWDRNRRFVRLIGEGTLVDPVALAVDRQWLYVADAGRDGVAVFDHFGGFDRMLAEGRAPGLRHVTAHAGGLWIVLPDRLLQYGPTGRLERVFAVDAPEPLVDVAFTRKAAYLLTATRLLRTPAN